MLVQRGRGSPDSADEGNKTINKLTVEHPPSKTAKQISDKRCLIPSKSHREIEVSPSNGNHLRERSTHL